MNRRSLLVASLSALGILSACSGGGGGESTPTTVTLSGTLLAASNMTIDTDSNDPLSLFIANNSLTTAQSLGNPMLAGGYVTATPTGVQGQRYVLTADPDDIYAVDLAAGQNIILEAAEPAPADLDLELYNDGGALVDASKGVGRFETVTANVSGRHFLRVNAFAGGSNYIVTVGSGVQPAASLRLAAEFVPGEAIVRVAPATVDGAGGSGVNRIASLGYTVKSGAADRPMLISLSRLHAASATSARLAGTRMSEVQAAKLDTLYQVKALQGRADLLSADLNYLHRPSAVPNDPNYPLQWHYPLIGLPQAWDVTTGTPASGEVVVAVVDTGVVLDHPDLASKLYRVGGALVGYDFISKAADANDGDGIDPNPDDPGDESTPGASSWHGTHVAGTIGAASNNGIGVAGVSWGARIMPVRVLGKGGGSDYDIMQGIRYAAGLSNDSGTLPARRADVINLSLGCLNCFSTAVQALMNEVRAAGVIVVASSGNENTSAPSYPSDYQNVVSVGAVGLDQTRAFYSNFGANLDVVAPGGDTTHDLNGDGFPDGVLSTLVGATREPVYAYYQGTSMAAPHVSGVAALMKAVHPGLTPADFDALLALGAITNDLGDPGRDDSFGWGLINAAKAVQEARRVATGASVATLSATPGRLDFGASLSSANLQLAKLGSGNLRLVGVTSDVSWLTVTPLTVDADNFGSYLVSVSRFGLSPGGYTATLTASDDSGGQLRLPVTLTVGSAAVEVNTGQYWLLLLDKEDNVVAQQNLLGSNGRYSYRFDGVAKGEYFLFAGTDSDWDDLICDPGEACGVYPTTDAPTLIDASQDRDGLDFNVGLSPSPGSAVAAGARSVPIRRLGGSIGKGVGQ